MTASIAVGYGEHEDWTIKAYASPEAAKAHVERLAQWVGDHRHLYERRFDEGHVAPIAPDDPSLTTRLDWRDARFSVEELQLKKNT